MDKIVRNVKESAPDGDLETYIELLNSFGIADGTLEIDGDTILASYNECYCPMMQVRNELISKTFCNCSCGWFEKLFENLLNKKVTAEVIESVISGGEKCRFIIHV